MCHRQQRGVCQSSSVWNALLLQTFYTDPMQSLEENHSCRLFAEAFVLPLVNVTHANQWVVIRAHELQSGRWIQGKGPLLYQMNISMTGHKVINSTPQQIELGNRQMYL